MVQHPPIVKDVAPLLAPKLVDMLRVLVMEQKHTATLRARINEAIRIIFCFAAKASVDYLSLRLGQQIWLNIFWELMKLHVFSLLLALVSLVTVRDLSCDYLDSNLNHERFKSDSLHDIPLGSLYQ
ncbi:MAG: hypothetical protein U9N82_06290, partial [Thermodesulfobacteriota bacterium]|nr:hypothetical protein [Thermodesulfobacteriota bacterium]